MKTDIETGAPITIDHSHHEVHEGDHYNLSYSVASVGGLGSPDDMMTLSFLTPNTKKRLHMVIAAICSSGARFRFIEGKTGGGASPTGVFPAHNSKRESDETSLISDVAGANVGNVSYDATLFTGGESLVDEYIGADGLGTSFVGGSARSEQEWILAPNALYQLSLFEADAVPGTIQMAWYEHSSII